MPTEYAVIKSFNNNVVLAEHQGTEKILIKKGSVLAPNRATGFRPIPISSGSL